MRSEGFLFLTGGSGGGTVFVPILEMISGAPAHVRARSFCARCAVPLGFACIRAVWWECDGAVPL